jgi:hypothetical protein
MTTWTVLNIIGWVFLVASWITPSLMKRESSDKHFVGGILAAIACGVFIGGLVVRLMN